MAHGKAPEAPWGLHLIADTTTEAIQEGAVVDIIAVHGLGANPDHAWVRHKDVHKGLERDVRWLTDLLPKTLRDYEPSISARIFCFNYQSVWLGPQLSRNRLENVATRLLDSIQSVRDKDDATSNRPIIFIGHSFGGLVIEQAVVTANSAGGRYEPLIKLLGGVVLLGTPHQGSKLQKWGSIIANIARLIDYGETILMEELEEKSMKILDMVSKFMKIMIRTDLAKRAVICFLENMQTDYSTRIVRGWGLRGLRGEASAMVVEEESGMLSGCEYIVLDSDHLKLNKYKNAEDGNYVSVSSNLARICAEAPQLVQRLQDGRTSSQNSHFLVPRERVKDFIGRNDLLDTIRSQFLASQTGPPPCVILHALGGQGKSQIALEYCRKWRETYRGVFWINANSETTATQSYGTTAAELTGASKFKTSDSAAQIRLVTGHLERWREAWLLVFDNYDDPENFTTEIKSFLPTKGHGHVLFTSRNRDLSRLGTLLDVPPMETEDGVRLLLRGYNDSDIQRQHKHTASSIVERLGNLALAIDQAAAYIKYKRLLLDRLGDFLTIYEAERKKVLTYTPENWEYKHINAFTTWELSFQQFTSGNEPWKTDAAHFLTLSAFFAPIKISESLFRFYLKAHGSEVRWIHMFSTRDVAEEDENEDSNEENDKASKQASDSICDNKWSTDQFWDIIVNSDDLSLLQSITPAAGDQGASFSLHPVIRDWLQLRLMKQERREYTQEAILVLVCCIKAYPDRSSTNLEERTALTTHMDVSMSNDDIFSKSQDKLGGNVANCVNASFFADFYLSEGRYRISEDLHRRIVETRRSTLGEKHGSTLTSMIDLAHTLQFYHKHGEAEQILSQTKSLMDMELGETHERTLSCMSSLTTSFRFLGRYGEAESTLRSILALREKEQIGDDLDVVYIQKRLAEVLSSQEKYDEAEEILQSTLLVQGKTLGKGHPNILKIMACLAETQVNQNKYEDAEQMCRQTLILQEKMFGSEHPDALSSLDALAFILSKQGKHEEAEKVCRRVLVTQETQLGKEHPITLRSINSLVQILDDLGRCDEAERLCRQTLILQETVLGLENLETLSSMEFLGLMLHRQGKYEEAGAVYQKALMLGENVLGPEHPNIFRTIDLLRDVLGDQGRYDEAESVGRQLLLLKQKVLGPEHPDTLRTMDGLGRVLGCQGRYDEAESVYRQLLLLRKKVLGPEHPDTLSTMDALGYVLGNQGRYDEAESVGRQLLILRENVLGPEHPDTLRIIEILAWVLAKQDKHQEAKSLYRQSLTIRENVFGKDHPDTLRVLGAFAWTSGRGRKRRKC